MNPMDNSMNSSALGFNINLLLFQNNGQFLQSHLSVCFPYLFSWAFEDISCCVELQTQD